MVLSRIWFYLLMPNLQVDELEDSYSKYASGFARSIYHCHKYMIEVPKFRGFIARETLGSRTLLECLSLPFRHMTNLAKRFSDARVVVSNKKFLELAGDVKSMQKQFSEVLGNTERLINMSLSMIDLPPAVSFLPLTLIPYS